MLHDEYSVRAHFEDEHPSPYFFSAVMREDVMRNAVSGNPFCNEVLQ